MASQTCCSFVCPSSTEANSLVLEEKKVEGKKWCDARNKVYARCSSQLELPVDLMKSTVLQFCQLFHMHPIS